MLGQVVQALFDCPTQNGQQDHVSLLSCHCWYIWAGYACTLAGCVVEMPMMLEGQMPGC
jgi:hypothetical protein